MSDGTAAQQEEVADAARSERAAALVSALGRRSIVLVGLMGSGKTSTGRRLAQALGIDFVDSDTEIEAAAGMPITEIFAKHGEGHFREGERRIIARLLDEGPRVLATGGGAFMDPQTRARIALSGISIWLKADHDVLWRRVRKRSHRPLLHGNQPEQILRRLMDERHPVYARADVTVISREGPHDLTVEELITSIEKFLQNAPAAQLAGARLQNESGETLGASQAKVRVELGPRSYEILIGAGLMAQAGIELRRLAPKAACAILTDETVTKLHLPALERALAAEAVRYASIVVPAGEGSKSFDVYAKVCNSLLAERLERGDVIFALGGGVIGDLAGFAAATVRRGMRFIQVPTTLLAQVDSSVGGKTGINAPLGKNLIGAFHQPSLVLADTATLDSLPEREFRAGYAEVVKYGLINDPGFFSWLETNWQSVFAGADARVHAIATSCKAKAAIVGRDEHEQGERALLNLGHTFGHALERVTGYDSKRLVHGEAVAIGMGLAFRFSARLGFCPPNDPLRVEAHLAAARLPIRMTAIPGFDASADALLDAMYQDKKVSQGALTFILARAIGDCFIARSIEASAVRRFLMDELTPGR